MRKILNCVLSLALVVVMSFAAVGCGKTDNGDGDKIIKETSIVLYDGNASDYIIVIPEAASNAELTAANELKEFFSQATGFTLPIETDKTATYGENEKYLSVGRTSLMKKAGVEAPYSKLGFDGYVIKTVGKSVFMCGGGDFGTQFSVYGFLRENLGWKFYADDEIVIPKSTSLNLKQFDYTDVPDFETRYLTYGALVADPLYARRLGLSSEANYMVGGGHSFFIWLPKETYYVSHPDWYSTDGNQLCLSNKAMRAELVERIKDTLVTNTDARYVMIGQEDIYSWCDCENCKAETDVYGAGGQNVRFLNAISDALAPWLKENMPDRAEKIRYIGYAYHKSETAPVKVVGNERVPIDDTVICRDNVMIELAPIYANFAYSIAGNKNTSLKSLITDWTKVCGKLFIYMYSLNAFAANLPYYNYNAISGNYKAFKELGVNTVFEQGHQRHDTTCLTELHSYVQAKLLWDSTLSVETLVDEFITQFYGPAAPQIKQYFESQRNWLNYCIEYKNYRVSPMTLECLTPDLWPKHIVDAWDKLLDDGIEALGNLKTTDLEAYEKYRNRIMQEKVSTIFMNIEFNDSHFTRDELLALIDEYEALVNKFHYTNVSEGHSNVDYIAEKRSALK